MAKKLTSTKAKKILHDKEVHGHPLTEQQRKFFGAIAGGAKPYKVESGGWLDKFDAPQAQNGIEGTMGGLTDKGFNFNPAWGGAWRDGGDLPKYQTGDTFTPYSRDYLTNFRDEWVKSYNQPIPYALPTDDRFDKFYLEKRATVPEYYETKSGWVRGLGTGMEEYREGDKNTPPRSMGKPAKGYEWVENYRDGPFRDDSQIREYTRLIKSIRNAESRKPVWNRDVKFNFKSGGILQPPMAGANQTVPMAQKGIRQPIYTSDRQDPRLRAYQDSLSLHNLGAKYIDYVYEKLDAQPTDKRLLWLDDRSDYQKRKDLKYYIIPESTFQLPRWKDEKEQIDIARMYNAMANKSLSTNILPIGVYEGEGHYPAFKKPVQPVEYKKRVLEKPNLSVDLPNIELTDVRPAIAQPTFEQARVDMSKPTKYSFTYPTFDQDVQKTMYFPDRNSWKTFVEQQRGASSQEGKDYGSATGQFAMGGSLPGSVGFTYARVSGAAPANGPYAKKTKASAQNGQEMKFYQEGLDFTPKTISKNGGWLDKYNEDIPKAQPGQVLQQRYSTGPMMGDLAQQSGVPSQAEVARQAQIRKEAAAREQQLAARARYEAMAKIGPAKQRNYSEQVQAEEQRRRLNQQYADQNPEVTTDESGDIVPSGYGRFMQTYGPNLDKFARSWETPLAIEGALSLAPLVGRGVVAGIKGTKKTSSLFGKSKPNVGPDEELSILPSGVKSDRHISQDDIQSIFKKEADWLRSDEYLKRRIAATGENPITVKKDVEKAISRFDDIEVNVVKKSKNTSGTYNPYSHDIELSPKLNKDKAIEALDHEIKHALSQLSTTGFSAYKKYPTTTLGNVLTRNFSAPKHMKYLNKPWEQQVRKLRLLDFINETQGVPRGQTLTMKNIDQLAEDVKPAIGDEPAGLFAEALSTRYGDVQQGYISGIIEANEKLKFVPQNLLKLKFPVKLQRQSYEAIRQTLLDQLNKAYAVPGAAAVGAASVLGSGSEEKPEQQQDGGDIPVDPMGYWNPENVGSPVIIPSNVITMEGVDQPLVGVSDTGDVQYMMPGEDYEFDGEYVTEYPVAKKGISVNNADAQPLKKLDQLLNFTNYNKPTKGGWLDKYN